MGIIIVNNGLQFKDQHHIQPDGTRGGERVGEGGVVLRKNNTYNLMMTRKEPKR